MKKNKLGRTNLEVSQITLGGGWVGGLFIDAEYKVMERAIELALASGINWIDTAPPDKKQAIGTSLTRRLATA